MRAEIDRRTIDDLIVKYTLEPSLRDIFVEGEFDRDLLNWVLKQLNCQDVVVFEIDSVEILQPILDSYGYTSGAKQRVLSLGRSLERQFGPDIPYIRCVVDADCDRILGTVLDRPYLILTDYASMEAYLMDEHHLGKILGLVLGCDIDPTVWINRYSPILNEVFLIRSANEMLGLGLPIADVTRCCSFPNDNPEFDNDDFINRCLNASRNNVWARKDELRSAIEKLRPSLKSDFRHQGHGHDFVALLRWSCAGAARKRGLQNDEAVHSAIAGCVDWRVMRGERVFQALSVWATDHDDIGGP